MTIAQRWAEICAQACEGSAELVEETKREDGRRVVFNPDEFRLELAGAERGVTTVPKCAHCGIVNEPLNRMGQDQWICTACLCARYRKALELLEKAYDGLELREDLHAFLVY